MTNRLSFPRNPSYCALLAALVCGTLSVDVIATDFEWIPEKTWTIDEASDMPQRQTEYYGANCQTGSTSSTPTGDVSGYGTLVTAGSVKIYPKGLTGAYTNDGAASGNCLEVQAGTVVSHGGGTLNLYGARSQKGDVTGNFLVFNGSSEMTVTMAGGYANGGNANGNTLEFGPSAKAAVSGGSSTLYGGHSLKQGTANNNTLILSGEITDAGSSAQGGASRGAYDANDNTVTVTKGAKIAAQITGGKSGGGNANGNTVDVQEGAEFLGRLIYGGRADNRNTSRSEGDASSNTVTFSGLATGKSLTVWGGFADWGNADQNTVTVTETARISTTFIDADQENNLYAGGYSYAGSASGNKLYFRASDEKALIYGGQSADQKSSTDTETKNNVVEVSGDARANTAYGGAGADAAANNSVTLLDNASVTTTYGGNAKESANDNSVIVGGQSSSTTVYGGHANGAATGNTVVLREHARADTVYGGFSYSGGNAPYENAGAADNTVELHDNAVVTGTVYASWNRTGKVANTGTIKASGTVSAGNLTGFDKLELTFSEANDADSGKALLTLTGSDTLALDDATVTVTAAEGTAESGSYKLVQLGNAKISLNENTSFLTEGTFFTKEWDFNAAVDEGLTEITDDLLIVNENLMAGDILIAGTESANDNSKTLAESLLGSVAFVNQGAEFIADEGMRAIVASAKAGAVTTFGAIHGGTSEYETGSHVDVDGVTLATGVATKIDGFTLAGFIEAGWASSESHVSGTSADGDHDYYGVGAAVRYEFQSPFYVDGALRLGMASTEFDGRYADASARYDADSFYGTMHVGAGYVFPVSDSLDLDVYGRYVLTYLDGDDVNLHTADGESYSMDSTTTHAFRIGARLTGAVRDNLTWRAGLAYEHVADGDAESHVEAQGVRAALDVPSLEGDTGILELGLTMKPDAASPWAVDLGLKGYAGDREGVAGSASVTYRF